MQRPKYISLTSATNVIEGVGHAKNRGFPLNRHLTISWWVAGIPGRVIDAQRELLQLASKWMAYRGVTPAYVWALEDGPVYHLHSHIVIHIPDHLKAKFRTMVNRWVKRVGGDPYATGAIKISPEKYNRTSKDDLVRYILKGIDLRAARRLGITPDYEKAGAIDGKRCGTSQNIGPKAIANYSASCNEQVMGTGTGVKTSVEVPSGDV